MTPLQRLELLGVRVAVALSRCLGPVAASNLGGWLARNVGPWLPVSHVARDNLARAFPELDAAARADILWRAWDNLGRTMTELPHVASLQPTASGPGWEIEGLPHLQPLRSGRGVMFSGHFGNWEVLFAAAPHYGLNLGGLYRAASNPGVGRLLLELRRPRSRPDAPLFAKGSGGARGALAFLRDGGVLAFLMDQKMNDGVEAKLLGQPAMTAPAMASMALRFRCPVVPACVHRLGPARFRLVIGPALDLPNSGNRADDILTLTQAVNDVLGEWIAERPGEWLWMHRRWPKL